MGFLLIGVFLLPFLPSVFLHKYQPITAALHSPESLVCHPRLPAVPHKLLKKLSFFSVASLQPALVTQNLVLFCICQLHSCPFRYQFNTFFLAFSSLQPKKKKTKQKNPHPTQELSACFVICPSSSSSTKPRPSAAYCRGGSSRLYFLLSFSISQNNLPAAPPFKLFLLQTHGFSEDCADLRNSM